MAEKPTAHPHGSPEFIAYLLMNEVINDDRQSGALKTDVTREYRLNTYAECLLTIRNPHHRKQT